MGVEEELGAVGGPGAPSAVGLSFDAVAVVDLGVMAFAEQAEVGQVGGSVEDPFEDLVGVAPPVRGLAAGEGAAAVAGVEGAALGGGDQALGAAEVGGGAAGAEDDAGDGGVAGDPSGAGGR
jgi:hypothetical protein